MKLRNKQTGEIGYMAVLQSKAIVVLDENAIQLGSYTSLAELNAEWEDVPEEPKEYYWIDYDGKVKSFIDLYEWQDKMKAIGNYFETKEEAEQAVKKLKAWKRLESHDLSISKGNRTFVNTDDVFVVQNVQFRIDMYGDAEEDLDLLFCTEVKNERQN